MQDLKFQYQTKFIAPPLNTFRGLTKTAGNPFTEPSLEGGLRGLYTHAFGLCGVRFESRKKNIQSITISPLKFENLTSALAFQARTSEKKLVNRVRIEFMMLTCMQKKKINLNFVHGFYSTTCRKFKRKKMQILTFTFQS